MPREEWRRGWYWGMWWRRRVRFDAKLMLAVIVCTPLVLYAAAADDFDGTLRAESTLYHRWKTLNPFEAAAYERFADDVKLGLASKAPVVQTPLGRALVAAARIASTRSAASATAPADEVTQRPEE